MLPTFVNLELSSSRVLEECIDFLEQLHLLKKILAKEGLRMRF
jgi:hypothetical protein